MNITMKDLDIGFLGLGLIGGSIARAIKKEYPKTKIQVYTRRKNPDLEKGIEQGIISNLVYTIDEHFSSCDIIFLCAPVLQNIKFLPILKPLLSEHCLITDVGSVKGNIHKVVSELHMEKNFIGGHPMAGSEKTGFANSSATLLEGAYYLLTPTSLTTDTMLRELLDLLACTGSQCVVLSPQEHDNITAAISHIPHIAAAALVNTVQKNELKKSPEDSSGDSKKYSMKDFAAGGFKDITRIASSSPEMWESICLSNKESIDYFLSYYIDTLSSIRKQIADGDADQIRQFFLEAGQYRASIPDKHK